MPAFVDLAVSSVANDLHQVENSGGILELRQVDVVKGRAPTDSHGIGHLGNLMGVTCCKSTPPLAHLNPCSECETINKSGKERLI